MHPYSDDELLTQDTETLKLAQYSKMVDSEVVSKIFEKVKEKGILNESIPMKIEKQKNIDNFEIEINDYIDQFIYYRNLRGYTQEQVGQAIGISGKQYYKYEKRIHKLDDINKIKKIAKFLDIQEDLILPNIEPEISNEKLKKYLRDNGITNSEFSKKINVSRRSIVDWFNKDTKISEDSRQKIREFIREFEEKKKSRKYIIEEEEEME